MKRQNAEGELCGQLRRVVQRRGRGAQMSRGHVGHVASLVTGFCQRREVRANREAVAEAVIRVERRSLMRGGNGTVKRRD